jgi:hypothetical protein
MDLIILLDVEIEQAQLDWPPHQAYTLDFYEGTLRVDMTYMPARCSVYRVQARFTRGRTTLWN